MSDGGLYQIGDLVRNLTTGTRMRINSVHRPIAGDNFLYTGTDDAGYEHDVWEADIEPAEPKDNAPATKATNPKDMIAANKAPLSLVPLAAIEEEALALAEGLLKYGLSNWRWAGVRTSVYLDAALRHLFKFRDGQDRDPETLVHHLGNVRACCGIILDAIQAGSLTDDRPVRNLGAIDHLNENSEIVMANLRELFKDCDPEHRTIGHFETD